MEIFACKSPILVIKLIDHLPPSLDTGGKLNLNITSRMSSETSYVSLVYILFPRDITQKVTVVFFEDSEVLSETFIHVFLAVETFYRRSWERKA